jgi:hypothetical protein
VAKHTEGQNRKAVPALRALGWFWVLVLALLGGSAGVLQWLGPPAAIPPRAAAIGKPQPLPPPPPPPAKTAPASAEAPAVAQMVPRQAGAAALPSVPPRAPGAPIPRPDPSLLEASTSFPDGKLPRIGPDGRLPMQAYAGGYDAADTRPKIGLLLSGFGMSVSQSEEAIRSTPAAVSFAVEPYSFRPQPLLEQARAQGHELLVSIPMEPQGFPVDGPGNQALMTSASAAVNANRLQWTLTRIQGYVGATGALGNLRGERFAASAESMGPVLDELARRGLLYVDPRPGAPRPLPAIGRSIDLVIDDPAVRPQIEARLAELEQIARDRGTALGLVELPLPVTVDRIAAWARTLADRGVTLAPVSALVALARPPRSNPTQ